MKPTMLVGRGLSHYWRTNVAVVVGVATAVAVLGGALLVGDSVRGSLRDMALQRLGRTDRIVTSTEFFREALGDALQRERFDVVPIIAIPGTAVVEAGPTGPDLRPKGPGLPATARVQVYGVDDRFWRFHAVARSGPSGRDAFVSEALARETGAAADSSLLVRVQRPTAIPIESVYGRKDNLARSIRLTVRGVVPRDRMGDFSLTPTQQAVRAVFVPLARLQRELAVAGRVNTLLVAGSAHVQMSDAAVVAAVRKHFALEDVGLTVRPVANGRSLAIESSTGVLDTVRAQAAPGEPIFTYLANTIRTGDREIPYSLVTALNLATVAADIRRVDGEPPPIVLNDWAARDLGVRVGAPIALEYYIWEEPGRLITRTADFQLAAVVPIAGAAADQDLAPVYPGITEAKRIGDWDPPFPIDLRRIRKLDEDYWDRFRTTPKAFIPLDVGQKLWSSRFGDRTSVRVPVTGIDPAPAIRARLDPIAAGISLRAVREEALSAARGATDFGEYFTYFSFFLVISALMLAALFFRLGIEQRAREVGLLRAVGFNEAAVRRLFLTEGILLAAIGAAVGVAGAVAYGAALMTGLRTRWSGAVGTTALQLHVSIASLAAAAIGVVIAGTVCIGWTLRGLRRISERSLLAGDLAGAARTVLAGSQKTRPISEAVSSPGRVLLDPARTAAIFVVIAAALLIGGATRRIDAVGSFFGAGASLLLACLFGATHVLKRPARSTLAGHGRNSLWRVGLRNSSERPGRSVLAIGVIASATFILIAVDAFRRSGPVPTDRHSGIGGYSLIVDLLVPIAADPNSRDGREALGLAESPVTTIDAFRVLPGDDASCLNLYAPKNPRVLGASTKFIDAGRFSFQQSLASNDAERANPWLLLNKSDSEGVVPVIGDANSLTYVLHKAVGDEIVLQRERPVRLRVVAALSDSVLQSELLMSDANFTRLFPEQEGFRFLLVETPAGRSTETATAIEGAASDLGADAIDAAARLAEFHTVENTYLSTFQLLGGLGLLIGTLGLGAVVLRNVLERRRELALLTAVGYRRADLFTIVLGENLLLLTSGLAIGAVSAAIAIAPAVIERGGRLPLTFSGAGLLVAVFVAGLVSSVVGTSAALRTPLLSALRSE